MATEKQMASHVKDLGKRVAAVESNVSTMKDSMKDIQSQLITCKDELFSAKQNFKFDKRSFTEETDDKLIAAEGRMIKRLEDLETELKKYQSKTDSNESKVNNLIKDHGQLNVSVAELTLKQQAKSDDVVEKTVESLVSSNMKNNKDINVFQSTSKSEKDSTFQAFAAKVKDDHDVFAFIDKVKAKFSSDTKQPSHIIWAYKIGSRQDAEDDKEAGASERILDIINGSRLNNVAVVMCRWFGGTHIWDDRWKIMEQCTIEVLTAAGLIQNPGNQQSAAPISMSSSPKTMYLADSTGQKVMVRRMIPGANSVADRASTLDAVQRKLKSLSPAYQRVIVQSGVNDMENCALSVMKDKIT